HRRFDQRVDALALRNGYTFLPLLRALWCRLAGRVADNDAVEALGMALGEAERGRAAHGEPGEMRLVDMQGIKQAEGVRQQRVERVAASRRVGAAMAALIVAQHAVGTLQ